MKSSVAARRATTFSTVPIPEPVIRFDIDDLETLLEEDGRLKLT